jgi:hypothetical protein
VKPTTNGTLPVTTLRVVPGCPSRSASTAETADRYAGTSGSTHGARNETIPARNATGIAVQLMFCPQISCPRKQFRDRDDR